MGACRRGTRRFGCVLMLGVLHAMVSPSVPQRTASRGKTTVATCTENASPIGMLLACASRRLPSVPTDLPRAAHTIDLGDNEINYLAPYTFKVGLIHFRCEKERPTSCANPTQICPFVVNEF